jgi:hypothetical protein
MIISDQGGLIGEKNQGSKITGTLSVQNFLPFSKTPRKTNTGTGIFALYITSSKNSPPNLENKPA